jgi:ATP-dependent DNA helicase RecG
LSARRFCFFYTPLWLSCQLTKKSTQEKISDKIEALPKLQKPQIAALKKLGIKSLRDLIMYFPYRYLDFSKTKFIRDLKAGEAVSVRAKIKTISGRFSFRGRMSLAEAVVSDETGSIKIIWFNQPYLAKSLKAGDELFLAGQPDYYNFGLQFTNPIYEKVSDFPVHTSRLVPLYHLKQGLYPKTFRNLIAEAIKLADLIPENLPQSILNSQSLKSIAWTIRQSHFPDSAEELAAARKRLAFEEIFYNQLLAQKYKLERARKQSFVIKFDQALIKTFVDSLPFPLTPDQKKAAWEILRDLQKPIPMNRLLEGDVGSGKTLVALIAALQAVSAGFQAVLLAPTEILALQHSQTVRKFYPQLNHGRRLIEDALLTNNYGQIGGKDQPREKIKKLAGEGMPGLYIGTHALLQKNVKFKNPALVIIDEQHRFGVEQRAELMKTAGKVPHLLSLSATPIPRTLQLAFFGELDVSQIKNKPVGRKPIITELVEQKNRGNAYEFIAKQINSGRQVFVITPLIEESDPSRRGGPAEADKLGVKAAKSEVENLSKIFPQFKIGLMHGRLKGTEKEKVMKDFLENKIQILVSTSVVEVGVDAPNASVMVIEGADRFGLAQLHQFRGRVGRAEHQSYCFLFSDNENPDTKARLESFTKTQDGFELAELDLKQRGFGEVYGQQQSGWNFKYFSPAYSSLIEPARREALAILKDDSDLDSYPKLKEKIKDRIVHFE